jgi:plasmid stability protein
MHVVYDVAMDTTVVQVRDLPTDVVATLKARAQARGQSLAAYLRDLLTDEAAKPPVDDVMAAIATRTTVSYTTDDLREMIEDGRR